MEECFTAEQLTNWRKDYGWTQGYATMMLGLSRRGYQNKENGIRHITRQDMKLSRSIDRDAAKKKVK
jgi:hypothetical protein